MKLEKALLALEGTNQLVTCDVLTHDGKRWLVPVWLDTPDGQWTKPARLILLDAIQHQRIEGRPGQQYAVNYPIPRFVLEGRSLPGLPTAFVVVEAPDLIFPRASRLN